MIDLSKLSQNMWETTPAKKKNPWDAPTTSGVGLNTAQFGPQVTPAGGGVSMGTSQFGPQMTQAGGTALESYGPPGTTWTQTGGFTFPGDTGVKTGGWETPTFPGLGSAGETKTTTGGNGTGGTYNPGQSGTLGTGASAPGWLGGGAYAKWGTQDPDYDPNDPNVPQDWWRSPSLNPEGGLVYNDVYGWQDRSDVKNKYKQGTAFDQFGYTPQLGQNWQDYYHYDGSGTPIPGRGTGGGGNVDVGDNTPLDPREWGDNGGMPTTPKTPMPGYPGGGDGPSGGPGGGEDTWYDPTTTGDISFQNQPKEWGTASSVLRDFATGGQGVDAPGEWNNASNNANQMYNSGGMATSASDAYQKAKQVAQTDTTDAIKQAAEQAGLGGTRWSSSMGRNAQDIAGRRMAELGSNFAQQEMGAQEAARGRQMEANNQLYGLGSGFAGLDTDTRNRALTATGQLQGLGQNMTRYPMELANQSFQMGSNMNQQDQSALDRQYQEAFRGMAENNPWLAKAMGMATGQGQQQQYTPGAGSQILGGLGSLLPFLFL
jgi:hypothetical protein